MIVIGLTGGIASGKSTVAAELRRLGLPVFDADMEARNAVAKGSPGLQLVEEAFGSEYLTAAGELDREKLSQLVFGRPEARKTLENIVHGIVWQQAEAFLQKCRGQGEPAVVLDVPLLIETGWHRRVDQVWLVAVSMEQQIERARARSGMSEEEARARIGAQLPLEKKRRCADVVLDNSGSLEATLAAVRTELTRLLENNSGC